jgi:hypothetical protein
VEGTRKGSKFRGFHENLRNTFRNVFVPLIPCLSSLIGPWLSLTSVQVNLGLHKTWEEAYDYVKSKRKIVHIPRELKPLLVQWAEFKKQEHNK